MGRGTLLENPLESKDEDAQLVDARDDIQYDVVSKFWIRILQIREPTGEHT